MERENIEITEQAIISQGVGSLVGQEKPDYEFLIKKFLYSKKRSESTKKTYRYALNRFFDYVESNSLDLGRIDIEDIVRYEESLLASKRTALTVCAYMSAVREFYKWTEACKIYPNIASSVNNPKIPHAFVKQHITVEGAERFMSSVYGDTDRNYLRNYAIVRLMIENGLRTVEVSRAKVGDIKVRPDGIRIMKVWGKGADKPDTTIVLEDDVWGPIKKYLETRDGYCDDDWLFATNGSCEHQRGGQMSTRSIQMMVKKHLEAVGYTGHEYSAHSLRHTAAVTARERGADWVDVKRLLRHSSLETTMIYTASIEREERLTKAPERFLRGVFNPVLERPSGQEDNQITK